MDSLDPVGLARTLIDIDSTTGREAQVGVWLSEYLRERGYEVVRQPVDRDRFNIFATVGAPEVVFSTHLDCVPPFFPSRVEQDRLFGRGACDAKGVLAAQVAAAEELREAGDDRLGLLFIVGEERGSDGARAANSLSPGCKYLINGEPTENHLALATRGVLRVALRAYGRPAHSSYPELGDSAIEKLITALSLLRTLPLPEDALLGRSTYTVGLISGGVAPNVVPPAAEAEVTFRTVGDAAPLRASLGALERFVRIEDVIEIPPVRFETLPGFPTGVFPFTTDVPMLSAWGRPFLLGPGSARLAHTDEECVSLADLHKAVGQFVELAGRLLRADDRARPRRACL